MIAHGRGMASVALRGGPSQAPDRFTAGTISPMRRLERFSSTVSEPLPMHLRRILTAVVIGSSLLAGCQTAPPPPPMVRPAAFIPLGVGAAYLTGDVIGG